MQRILVTGASQGIGHAICAALSAGDFHVQGVSRRPPAQVPRAGSGAGRFTWSQLDLSRPADIARFASLEKDSPLDALILSAVDYGASRRHPAAETAPDEWFRVIATNTIGQSILTSLLLPTLLKAAPGVLINISSDVAVTAGAGRAAYAASKAGLHATLRAVAAENAPDRLRVYQFIPAFQSLTPGIRSRRPDGFDFSGYADPSVLAGLVCRILSRSALDTLPGTYLVRRDGSLEKYFEAAEL
jgi:NAD(P)-dependent dehydrogenase (short-subunit alcohol dehydrogenase family)